MRLEPQGFFYEHCGRHRWTARPLAAGRLLFFAPLALAACGGGSTGPGTGGEAVAEPGMPTAAPWVAAANQYSYETSFDFAPFTNQAGTAVIVSYPGGNTKLDAINGAATEGYVVAEGIEDGYRFLASIAGNGDAVVSSAYRSKLMDPSATAAFISVERLKDTQMPLIGSATYSGDYLGHLGTSNLIRGDFMLSADFGEATVSGAVTNRAVYDNDLNVPSGVLTTNDITFEAGTIDSDGHFSGEFTGGSFEEGAVMIEADRGYYTGYVTGEEGGSVAGGLRNRFFTAGGDAFYEVGTFLAE